VAEFQFVISIQAHSQEWLCYWGCATKASAPQKHPESKKRTSDPSAQVKHAGRKKRASLRAGGGRYNWAT
jgi:hypothetical protein